MVEELLQIFSLKAVVKSFGGLGLCSPFDASQRFWDPGKGKDGKSERQRRSSSVTN